MLKTGGASLTAAALASAASIQDGTFSEVPFGVRSVTGNAGSRGRDNRSSFNPRNGWNG